MNNVADEYEIYYQSGEASIYNNRFGPRKFSYREKNLIRNVFKNVKKRFFTLGESTNVQIFKILDYGSGDGRIFGIIENLSFENSKMLIQYIAYDPCITALNNFENKLSNKSYVKRNYTNHISNKSNDEIIINEYVKNNLIIKLVCSKIDINLTCLTDILGGNINLIICMFAVLCHIPGRINRQKTLNIFNKILHHSGEVIINVSTSKSLSKEVSAYNFLRNQINTLSKYHRDGNGAEFLKLANEPGDIYYIVENNNKCAHIYGHVYNSKELKEDTEIGGLTFKRLGILSYKQPYELTRNRFFDFLDQFISIISSMKIMPFRTLEKYSKNIFLLARKND